MGQRLSEEAKQNIVLKALNKSGQTQGEIARSQGVGLSSLNKWIKRYKENESIGINHSKQSGNALTSAQKFDHLQATHGLEETALGIYCRTRGLFSYQLTQWKDEFMTQNKDPKNQKQLAELKVLRQENKMLKREVHRKDKALAETAALLVLKKKMSLLFGENEED